MSKSFNFTDFIFRTGIGLVFIIFAIETFWGLELSPFNSLSLDTHLHLKSWTGLFIKDLELQKNIIAFSSLIIGIGYSLGIGKKYFAITIIALMTIGMGHSNFLTNNISALPSQNAYNLLICIACLRSISNKKFLSQLGNGIYLTLTFIGIFIWVSPDNVLWSYYFEKIANTNEVINLPLIAATIGSIGTLLTIRVTPLLTNSTNIALIALSLLINGLSGYVLFSSLLFSLSEIIFRIKKLTDKENSVNLPA